MKALQRIILVNWYLFEAEEWEVNGHVALVGKNGSGKSSFIDALQYVCLGGNKTDWQPNAKATDRRRTRDVRSYVLGLIKDEDALTGATSYQPRPDALCRIVLVYVDDATGESTSIGAALSARRSEPQEHVEGFFIAERCALSLTDLLEHGPAGNIPKPYGALRQFIGHKSSTAYFFGHEPKAFVTQMLASLGPEKRALVTEKYRRSFKQSINMSGLEGSVSEFVRSSILDDKPINLEQMRQSENSWRKKLEAVARINDQIIKLEKILDHLRRAQNNGIRRAGRLACAAEFRFMAAEFRRNELATHMDELIARYRATRLEKRAITKDVQHLEANLQKVQRILDNDDNEATLTRLREQHNQVERDMEQSNIRLKNAQQRLAHASELALFSNHLLPAVARQVDMLADLSQDFCGSWPEDPQAVDSAVADMKALLPEMLDEIEAQREGAAVRVSELKKAEVETQRNLDRLRTGKSLLHANTQTLIETLKGNDIEAIPVCDLVEVTDPEWQPAIEAFLASNSQALIVDPGDAERAIELYRRVKRNVYGSTVVNTLKVANWKERAEPGTASALIRGSNSLAVAYVQRLLRNIRLRDVETGALMNEERALSKDGMFVANASIQRKQPRPLMLGKSAREAQLAEYERQHRDQQNDRNAAEELQKSYRALHTTATTFMHNLNELPNLATVVSEQMEIERTIQSLKSQIEAIDTSHLEGLRAQKERLDKQITDGKNQLERWTKSLGEIRGSYKTKHEQHDVFATKLPKLSAQRQKCREDADFVAERANELMAELEETMITESEEGYEDLARKAEELADKDLHRQNSERQNARDLLGEYRATYPSDGFIMEPLTPAGERAQLELMLNDLRNIGLHEREQEVQKAVQEFQRIVRTDLALKLRSNIRDMRNRFNELNTELKRRPFSSNQIYQFHYAQRKEFSEFLAFVEQVDEHITADTGGLFDEFSHINEQIREMLYGEHGSEMADYRQYYTFDIEIRDTDSGINEMLSRRLGAASGGEHKTPFYVAMGASLASAYRLEHQLDDSIDGGVSLYLADEAFEKMDAFNTVQAANYLKSIGLQLFIAAPDDAEPRLRQIVNTVLFFIREGDKAWVDADYLTEAAKELLSTTYNPAETAHA